MAIVSHKSVISPVLIGRKRELEMLDGLLVQSQRGQGQLALVVGEAGIGKSRLAAEMRERARAVGFVTQRGHCIEPDHLLPYAPLLEILRQLLADPAAGDVQAHFGAAAGTVAKFFPELDLPTVETPPIYTDDQEKRLLHHSLTRVLLARAVQQPLLLIVEDLHWCDEATLDFLRHLVRHVVDHPILLLLTYRGDEIGAELGAFLDAVARQRVAVEVALTPLTMHQVDTMMRAIFDLTRPVRADFLQAVSELTEGNPFFIEEVLKALLAVGDIYYDDHIWDRRPLGELRIPRTVADAVQRRAANLSAPAQALLALAAVAGRHFDVAILQAVTGQDDATLLAALKELIAAQLIVEAGVDEFTFRHALTQHALYTNLLARERQLLHRALAQTLVQHYPERLDTLVPELAYHYHAGGAWAEALDYTRRAGDHARARDLYQVAIKQYSRALKAAEHLPATAFPIADRVALLRARGQSYETTGKFDLALADLEEALKLARTVEDLPATVDTPATWQQAWQLLIDLGFLWASRDYTRTGDYYQQALALAQRWEDPTVLAHTYNRVGNWHLNRGDCAAALAAHRQALEIFETQADRHALAQTYDLLGMTCGHFGDPACIAYYEHAAAILREVDDRIGLIFALAVLGPYRTYFSRLEEFESQEAQAAADFAEAQTLAQRMSFQAGESFVLSEYAQSLVWSGDYAAALTYAHRSLELAQEIEHRQWLCAALTVLGNIELDLMNYVQAHRRLTQAWALAQEIGSRIFIQIAGACLALMYLEMGEEGEAAAQLGALHMDAPVSYHDHFYWLARMRLALYRKDPRRVLADFEQVQEFFGGAYHTNWITLALHLTRGEALAALDDPEAERVLREVCRLAERKQVRSLLWRAQISLGNCLRAMQRMDDAASAYDSARSQIEELAAGINDTAIRTSFPQRALAFMPTEATTTARPVAPRGVDGLTAAEQEVAALVAQGLSNRAIAAARVVSIKTIEAHVSHILGKLGFTSRAQIAVWAVERGLTTSATPEEQTSP